MRGGGKTHQLGSLREAPLLRVRVEEQAELRVVVPRERVRDTHEAPRSACGQQRSRCVPAWAGHDAVRDDADAFGGARVDVAHPRPRDAVAHAQQAQLAAVRGAVVARLLRRAELDEREALENAGC